MGLPPMPTRRTSRETMGGSRLSVDVGGSKTNVKRRSKELLGLSDVPDPADLKWTTEVSALFSPCALAALPLWCAQSLPLPRRRVVPL